jgi:hypothetical protein
MKEGHVGGAHYVPTGHGLTEITWQFGNATVPRRTTQTSAQNRCFVFCRSRVQISTRRLAILIYELRGFPQFFQKLPV